MPNFFISDARIMAGLLLTVSTNLIVYQNVQNITVLTTEVDDELQVRTTFQSLEYSTPLSTYPGKKKYFLNFASFIFTSKVNMA